jgi:hypothetical protein
LRTAIEISQRLVTKYFTNVKLELEIFFQNLKRNDLLLAAVRNFGGIFSALHPLALPSSEVPVP